MQASKKQLIVQSRMQIAKLKGDIYWEEQYLEYLTKGDLL
jgi:hypothetical protein